MKYTLDREVHQDLRELLEDSVEHICDKHMISGELAWLVAQTLAESKLYEMKKDVWNIYSYHSLLCFLQCLLN